MFNPRDQAQKRRFARAVCAAYGQALTRLNAKGKVAENPSGQPAGLVHFGDISEFYHDHASKIDGGIGTMPPRYSAIGRPLKYAFT